MKNEALYNRTVDILVQAYLNDTLEAGNCAACAVGNLIASNKGYKPVVLSGEGYWEDKDGFIFDPKWIMVLSTPVNIFGRPKKQLLDLDWFDIETKEEIESSGYKISDFAKIENAFEVGYRRMFVKDRMFAGLMSVIEALDLIHENTNTETTKASKQKFIRA